MANQTIEPDLARLRKAVAATKKILFGDLADEVCRVAAKPDLSACQLQLARLTATLEFDCFEVARILTSWAELLPESKSTRVADAASSLLCAKLPPQLQPYSTGIGAIRTAAESGDVVFFIELGERLRYLRRAKKGVSTKDGSFGLKFSLATLWQPSGRWPGLAYCKNAARREFLADFCGDATPSKRNFDNIWRRMGLVSAKRPFISRIRQRKSGLEFS